MGLAGLPASFEVLASWTSSGWMMSAGLLVALALTAFVTARLGRLRTRAVLRRSRAQKEEIRLRVAAERELLAQRSRLESVLECAHDGIFCFDGDGLITYANPAMHWIFGATTWELTGQSVLEFHIPGLGTSLELSGVRISVQRAGRWTNSRGAARRKTGELFDLEISVTEDEGAGGGDQPAYIGVVRDISERAQMLDQLKKSEHRFRTLFQAAPTAIAAWHPGMSVVDWNQSANALFGWEAAREVVESKPHDLLSMLVDPNDVESMREAVRSVLSSGHGASLIARTTVAPNERGEVLRRCRWRLAPLARPNERPWAFITLVTDISDEERLSAQLQSLRERVARAEEGERARLAHELHEDLSQRLAAVALDVQLAENQIKTSRQAAARRELFSVRHALDELSTDMQHISRRLHPAVVDDLGLFAALRSECASREGRAGVVIHCDDVSGVGDVRGTPGLALFRVAQEALDNALRHGRPSEIFVALEAAGDMLELTVEDNGAGFDQSFVPEDGVGLVSMRERVELLGGALRVHSSDEAGTRIVASVPRDRAGHTSATVALPGAAPGLARVSQSPRNATDGLDEKSL